VPNAAKPPNVSRVVLDASAVLALLQREPGAEKLTIGLLVSSAMSTVNLGEVQTKLVREGGNAEEAWRAALAPVAEIHPFSAEQAKIAGSLVARTSSLGLSFGDRACLALAMVLDAPVYTTEQIWKNLKIGVDIRLIR
jgi:PIN domain nuclease of toxin-antitoxin system